MNDVVPELTTDEAACLLIMKDSTLIDMGEYSKWHEPINSLAARKLCSPVAKFNNGYEYAITDAGRQVAEAWEDQSLRDVIEANNRAAARRPKLLTDGEVLKIRVHGLSPRQIYALASFYTNATGKMASEICPP